MNKRLTADRSGGILIDLSQEFNETFLNNDACRWWLIDAIYPGGVFCPKCGAELVGKRLNSFYSGKRARCPACCYQWSTWKNTPLHNTHFSPGKIILIGFLASLGIPTSYIARRVRCSSASVKLTMHKIDQIEVKASALSATRVKPAGTTQNFKAPENIRPDGHRPETEDDSPYETR